MTENETLRETINERNAQLESAKNESFLLQAKIATNESDMNKFFDESKKNETKHANETIALEARIKEVSDSLSQEKKAAVEASKTKKSLEKNVYNLEKKVENLNNKIESLKTSKNDFNSERDNLMRKIKNLQKHSLPLQVTKSAWTQTDTEQNNNLTTTKSSIISTCSISVQTSEYHSSKPIPIVNLETLDNYACFVCNEDFHEARKLKDHAQNEHTIELQLATLLDYTEDDPFVRFVKSINMGHEYVSKRRKLHPEHWDQIEERINIRMMAKKKLEICSKHIENNMKKNDVNNINNHRKGYDWAKI